MNRLKIATLSAMLELFLSSAHGQVSLNFIIPGQTAAYQEILNYYDGGASQEGQVGPNYGITFGSGALSLLNYPFSGSNVGDEPGGGNSMFFMGGVQGEIMNVAAGFTGGFSFYETSLTRGSASAGYVNVYSGLDGTGTLLASLSVPATGANRREPILGVWDPVGVNFAGTAESVDFSGSDELRTENPIAFSDVTLGSATPIVVPEPSMVALGLIAASAFRLVWLGRGRFLRYSAMAVVRTS